MNAPQAALIAHVTANPKANVKTAWKAMRKFGDSGFWDAIRTLRNEGKITYDAVSGALRLV